MHKSYKRKNARNKTRKKYNKVGGEDGPISEQKIESQITEMNTKITSLYNLINSIMDEIPVVCIGYKNLGINNQSVGGGYSIHKIPLCVKSNIDLNTFLQIIKNNNGLEINLKNVHSLPNIRDLPFESFNVSTFGDDDEDRMLFHRLNKTNIQKLQVKYHNLFERPTSDQIRYLTAYPDKRISDAKGAYPNNK